MKEAGDLFDEYSAAYEEALAMALSPSGESREYFAAGRVAWLKRCLGEIGFQANFILDFGCGDGATASLLVRELNAASAVGVDVSPKSLELARKQYATEQIRFESLDQYQAAGIVDLAYCNGVFHHIPPPKRAGAAAIVRRALRDGGLFSLWENNAWNPATRYVMSRCAFDSDAILLAPPEARKLLRENGFDILRTDYRFVFPHALRAFRGIENWVYRLPLGTQYQVLARKIH